MRCRLPNLCTMKIPSRIRRTPNFFHVWFSKDSLHERSNTWIKQLYVSFSFRSSKCAIVSACSRTCRRLPRVKKAQNGSAKLFLTKALGRPVFLTNKVEYNNLPGGTRKTYVWLGYFRSLLVCNELVCSITPSVWLNAYLYLLLKIYIVRESTQTYICTKICEISYLTKFTFAEISEPKNSFFAILFVYIFNFLKLMLY